MTPEIKELEAQIVALSEKRVALMQAHLATKAIAQIGELITWGQQGRKGRVLGYEDFCGHVSYIVRAVLKSGKDGEVATVRYYDNPKLTAA
jgi:hypothetical protein